MKLPDVSRKYYLERVRKFLVEMDQEAVGHQEAAEDEEGVYEEVPVEEQCPHNRSVLLKILVV